MREVDLLLELAQQVFAEGQGVPEPRLEAVPPFGAHERVRIFAVRQEQEPQFPPVPCHRQRILERTPRGRAPRTIAVETKNDLAREPKDLVQMLLRRRRAERGHGIRDARLMQAHDVHVALDDHEALEVGAREPRLMQSVEFAALVE